MTRLFQEDGRHVPVTVLALEDCQVVSLRTEERDGYVAVQLGAGTAKQKNVAKPQREHFAKAQVPPKAQSPSSACADDAVLEVGADDRRLALRRRPARRRRRPHAGQGLCGRHEALGFRRHARHPRRFDHPPCARFDRPPPGSGHVFKNKKMAGHMGDRQRTQQNLEVVRDR